MHFFSRYKNYYRKVIKVVGLTYTYTKSHKDNVYLILPTRNYTLLKLNPVIINEIQNNV